MSKYKSDKDALVEDLAKRIDQVFISTDISDNEWATKINNEEVPFDYSQKYINRLKNHDGLEQFLKKYFALRVMEKISGGSIFDNLIEAANTSNMNTPQEKNHQILAFINHIQDDCEKLKKFFKE